MPEHVESMVGKYKGVVSLLRFFIDDNRYSIVDRIAFALSPESAEVAILEALRIVKSLMDRAVRATVKVETKGEGVREYSLTCCDYGEGDGPGILGEFKVASEARLVGKKGYCVPCPLMPTSEELEELIDELRRDLTIGRKIAILAYGYRKGVEKE